MIQIECRRKGGLVAGRAAVHNKTGIHSLSKDQTKRNSLKGVEAMRAKFNSKEYRALHAQKIRYGRLKKRFDAAIVAMTHYVEFTP